MIDQERRFLEAYDSLSDAIFRHCYFRVSDKEKAHDLVQETFTKAWHSMMDGKEIENLKAYLYRIANNLIVDHYRKKKDVSLDVLQEDGFEPSVDERQNIENFVAGHEVLALLENLDEKYREVITLRYVDDLPVKQIAEIMGESENVISVRIYRALRKLREICNA